MNLKNAKRPHGPYLKKIDSLQIKNDLLELQLRIFVSHVLVNEGQRLVDALFKRAEALNQSNKGNA